jgi:hypothetical protein
MNKSEIKAWIFEEIHKVNCPQCNNSLKISWISDEEKNKLTFSVSDPRFDLDLKNGSELTQVEYCYCSNCNWKKPTLIVRDIHVDISPAKAEKYQKEKALVEKIANTLLPNHSFKVRFIVDRDYKGITLALDKLNRRTYGVCFNIELLLELEKEDSGIFMDVIAHELAHAEVFKNPQYDFKNAYYCSCKTQKAGIGKYHEGEGHDKIWHDKYDEFREKIKNEKLAEGSGYQALGKDFVRSEYKKGDNNDNDNNKPKPEKSHSSFPTKFSDKESKVFWWIGGSVIFILSASLLVYLFRKRKKIKKV